MTNVKLYTVKEAAKIVGVSTNTLYKYLDEDRIHAARGSAIQGRFRIPQSALEEFLGVKLSSPEPEPASDPYTPGVKGSHTPGVSDAAESQINRLTDTPISPTPHLPTRIARLLLVFVLLALLADLFLSRTVSLPAQLSRLIAVMIMLLLAYADGGYRHG